MHYIYILYLTLPAFVANVLPVIAAKFNFWNRLAFSIDHNQKIFGKRIFGEHKTWRGLVVGVIGAIIISFIQYILFKFKIGKIDDLRFLGQFLLFGFLSGLGALSGDSIESFIKRQFKIDSGKSFFPFDQIDYIFGFIILSSFLIKWSWPDILFLVVFSMIIAPLVSIIGYLTKIKKNHH